MAAKIAVGGSVPAVPEGMAGSEQVAAALADLQQNDPMMRNLINPDLSGVVMIMFTNPDLVDEQGPAAMIASLRELEALVVLDRVKSGSDSLQPVYDHEYTGPRMAGDQVRKTFVLHATGTGSSGTGNPFTLGNASATARVGTQRMDLRTLLPASPAYRVVNEGGPVGQFRIEYDVSGSEMSYLLNVVGARDAAEAPVSVSMDDLGDSWRLQLTQPGKGSATVVLRKGEASNGGSVRIGNGPVQSLRSDVQGMLLTADGPVWTGGGTQGSGGISTGGNQRPAELPARSGGAGVDPQPVATGTLAPLATAGSDEGGARGTAGPLHGFQARIVRLHGAIIESWRRGLALLRALAGLEAAELGSTCSVLTSRAVADLARGQMLDVERAFDVEMSAEDYLAVVEGKTAPLFRLSCELGAVQGGCPVGVRRALAEFGTQLGVAFQILDDCLDLETVDTGKPVGRDLALGLFGAPILCALQAADDHQLAGLLLSPTLETTEMADVVELVERQDGIATARRLAADRIPRTLEALDSVPMSPGRDSLVALAQRLLGAPA